MTAFVGAVFLVVAAVWLILALKAPARVHEVLTVSRQGMAFMQDKALSDDEKEAFLQRQSLQLFRLAFLIVVIFVVALAAPTAALWALGKLGVLSFDEVIRISISVKFLVGCTVAGTLIALVLRRRKA